MAHLIANHLFEVPFVAVPIAVTTAIGLVLWCWAASKVDWSE